MSKKVIVISTSMRNNANSDILADEFIKGAKSSGNITEKISLKGKNIAFCKGCLACQITKKCNINDDVQEIFDKVVNADVVVWVTPVYYYSMSGQMKTLIDRLNPIFVTKYKFQDVYLIATAADSSESAIDGTIKGIMGWIECLNGTRLKKVLKAVGLTNPNEVKTHDKYLKEAYEMGKNI